MANMLCVLWHSEVITHQKFHDDDHYQTIRKRTLLRRVSKFKFIWPIKSSHPLQIIISLPQLDKYCNEWIQKKEDTPSTNNQSISLTFAFFFSFSFYPFLFFFSADFINGIFYLFCCNRSERLHTEIYMEHEALSLTN